MPVVHVTASAARQLVRARRWWRANRDKAPAALEDDLEELIRLLEARPALVGRRVGQRPGVRRVHLPRIRYYAYFEIADGGDRVLLLALWHVNRGHEPGV